MLPNASVRPDEPAGCAVPAGHERNVRVFAPCGQPRIPRNAGGFFRQGLSCWAGTGPCPGKCSAQTGAMARQPVLAAPGWCAARGQRRMPQLRCAVVLYRWRRNRRHHRRVGRWRRHRANQRWCDKRGLRDLRFARRRWRRLVLDRHLFRFVGLSLGRGRSATALGWACAPSRSAGAFSSMSTSGAGRRRLPPARFSSSFLGTGFTSTDLGKAAGSVFTSAAKGRDGGLFGGLEQSLVVNRKRMQGVACGPMLQS